MKFFVFSLIIFHPFVLANSTQGLLNKQDQKGLTQLHLATVGGDIEQVKKLIANGADLDIQDQEGNTPLATAIEYWRINITRELLENGANPNIPDKYGNTPFDKAVVYKQPKTVLWLLEKGAKPSTSDIASRSSFEETKNLLFKYGATNPTIKSAWLTIVSTCKSVFK